MSETSPDNQDFSWESFEDLEEATPDYENACRIQFNMRVDDKLVERVASDLAEGLDGNKANNKTDMAVVLINLYRCYLLDPEKWLVYVRRKGNYKLVFKYNRNRIGWTSLVKVIDGLISRELVDHALGFWYRNQEVGQGKCSRVRARDELISLLEEQYGFTPEIIQRHPDEEVIILKDTEKNLIDYKDNNRNQAARKRAFVRQYNGFLNLTYLDLNADGFKPKESLHIDLSRRNVYRVFNNNSFTQNGRFFGGWWEEIPSELRLQIIINNLKIVEFDYSGVHIHMLYAQQGIDFSTLGKDAYQLPGYPETAKMRQLFKDLLLVAINACGDKKSTGEMKAIKALRRKISSRPSDYPEGIPDLKKAINDFGVYHEPIKESFYTGVGLNLMYLDSQIAEDVLRSMLKKEIPVLSVHDSFICPKLYEEDLYQAMKTSYQKHCKLNISKIISPPRRRAIKPGIKIKEDELDRQIEYATDSDAEYYYDITTITNESLIQQMLLYGEEDVIETDIYIKIDTEGNITRKTPLRGVFHIT